MSNNGTNRINHSWLDTAGQVESNRSLKIVSPNKESSLRARASQINILTRMLMSIKRQIALYSIVYLININIQLANSYAIDQSHSDSNNLLQREPQTQARAHQNLQNPQLKSGVLSRRQPEPTGRSDSRRPIWNLAHMVNSIKELDYRLG